jgi:hypothetical protein
MRNLIIKYIQSSKLKHLVFLPALAVGAWFLSGCQSNTIYFGTNTQFGIRAGVDTKQIPEVQIGYNRQEGVMLPLTVDNGRPSTNSTSSCCAKDMTPANIENEKFIGENNQGIRKDAYSVIAIFSGNAAGNVSPSTNNATGASMGVSQYFATGVAAQLLAEHGASVVGGSGLDTATAAQLQAIVIQDSIKPLRNAYVYFSANDATQLPNFDAAAKTVVVNGNPLYTNFQNFLAGIPQAPTATQVAAVRANLESNATIKSQIK